MWNALCCRLKETDEKKNGIKNVQELESHHKAVRCIALPINDDDVRCMWICGSSFAHFPFYHHK